MKRYELIGIQSEMIHAEGSKPELSRYLLEKYPTPFDRRKESNDQKVKQNLIHEPMKIQRVDAE